MTTKSINLLDEEKHLLPIIYDFLDTHGFLKTKKSFLKDLKLTKVLKYNFNFIKSYFL